MNGAFLTRDGDGLGLDNQGLMPDYKTGSITCWVHVTLYLSGFRYRVCYLLLNDLMWLKVTFYNHLLEISNIYVHF